MRCCDCEFRYKCDDTQNVLTAFVKCSRREEFMNSENRKKPATNADRIRAMSDEEMATELINTIFDLCEDGVPREDYVLNWLRQPAEED